MNGDGMNLRRLQHLVLLAEELSFARAAERAYLSQSAFSRSIQTLEDEVGMRLFDRGLRYVQLTPVGKRVQLRAQRLLSSSHDLERELRLLKSGDLGNISLGGGPFSGHVVLPRTIAQLHHQHPSVQVSIVIDHWAQQLQNLHAETIDFFTGDIRELEGEPSLLIEPIGVLYGAVFCRTDHPLASRDIVSAADIAAYGMASVHLPSEVEKSMRAMTKNPRDLGLPISFQCEDLLLSRELVLQTDALLIAPHMSVQHELMSGQMKELVVQELESLGNKTPLQTPLGTVRMAERTLSPAADILLEIIAKTGAELLKPPLPLIEMGRFRS